MNQTKTNVLIGLALIIFAAILKVVTYPQSFNPIIAIALFSGAVITDRKMAFAMPLLAMFVSDLIFQVFNIAPGFYGLEQIGNYASLLLITVLGFGMKKINVLTVAGFSIASSLLFYALSNTNTFLFDTFNTYPNTFSGWVQCMTAGIPFIKLDVNLIFSAILFGSHAVAYKAVKETKMAA